MTKLQRGIAAAGGLLLLLTTGCSSAIPQSDTEPSSLVSQAESDYETMWTSRTLIERAEQQLKSECMATSGFKYLPLEPLPIQWRQLTHPLTVAAASIDGYASIMLPVNSPTGEANTKYIAELSDAGQERYSVALNGSPDLSETVVISDEAGSVRIRTTGCGRQADRELFGDPIEWAKVSLFLSDIPFMPQYTPQDDPALKSASGRWSKCMKEAGYHVADPNKAFNDAVVLSTPRTQRNTNGDAIPLPTPGVTPGPARNIAVADATCRADTGWDEANRRAALRALSVVLAVHEPEVRAYNSMAAAGVTKARTVLGE